MTAPSAEYVGRRPVLLLAAVPLVAATLWGTHHLIATVAAFTGRGNPLATTWLIAFALLWWIVLAWFEAPATVTPRKARKLDKQVVAVSIPAYNEDPALLSRCIQSLLDQTRRPDRVHVVDDGSEIDYSAVRAWLLNTAPQLGVEATWKRTENRGKRHAQMEALADDPADIFVTLDSDSVLDRRAIGEGLAPFADPRVQSVAGMVVVWNSRANLLTRLTCMLYTPFTRGFRSAQSVLGRVMVNSGTLAFYRSAVIRKYAGSYEHEQFMGRPMQMNDDSMMTFYGLIEGRCVHQPSSVAFTIVPQSVPHYLRQQLRWMRGTFIRTWWWARYLSPKDVAFWMPLGELTGLLLSIVMGVVFVFGGRDVVGDRSEFLWTSLLVALLLNYTISLRYFVIRRSDESLASQIGIYLLAPVAGLWRFLVLRPLMIYAYLTFWRVGSWGTRSKVEVSLDADASKLAAA